MLCGDLTSEEDRLNPTPAAKTNVRDLDTGRTGADPRRVEGAVRHLLKALGADVSQDDFRETPARVALMYRELLYPRPFTPTTFANDAGYDELVVVREIPFVSLCQHHMLPFHGLASLGYLPGERIVGLSKLARLVEYFARSFQVQERLTKQIADWMQDNLSPRGVGVVLQAEHQCMTIRGVRSTGSSTVTSTMYGLLRENAATRQEFLALAGAER